VLGDEGVEGARGVEEIEREGHTSGDNGVVGAQEGPGTRLLGF